MLHVHKTYSNGQKALIDVSLKLDKGEFVYIIGPCGAGKTSILKLIYCAQRPTKGMVLFGDKNVARIRKSRIPYLRRNIGIVFQDFKLIKTRTVFENVALALEVIGATITDIQKKVWKTLSFVGLYNKSNEYPIRLSGGEQQRVAIARAMVNNPLILLADEPTGNLDPEMTVDIIDLLDKINIRGTTVLVATHNPDLAKNKRKVFTLEKGRITNG
jgi:cell division transport system ATP-binding protein